MKSRLSKLAGGVAGMALAVTAPAAIWNGTAEIVFDATSTLHDFSGAAAAEPFVVDLVQDAGQTWISCTAAVAVARLDTRHAKRDANMRAMFAAERFPLVSGILAGAAVETAALPATLPLTLVVLGRPVPVAAVLQQWRPETDRVGFELGLTVSLKELGLAPPVMLGILRVGDAVAVRVRGELVPAGSP